MNVYFSLYQSQTNYKKTVDGGCMDLVLIFAYMIMMANHNTCGIFITKIIVIYFETYQTTVYLKVIILMIQEILLICLMF